jgi:2-methylisocitrate lyase-like PEP mutase family enzyme
MTSVADKRLAFRRLHERGCFVIPNPWDAGTARYLAHLGFSALATTSGGAAFSMGLPDGSVPLARMLTHIAEIAAATELPVSADFENGHADEPKQVGENVRKCVDAGVAGLSIEDFSGKGSDPLYPIELGAERVRAAREAIDRSGGGVLLTARAEGFLRGHPNLDEIIRRLSAYSDAGADCLFAPGITEPEHIKAVVAAVAPKPVNVLVATASQVTLPELAALGVRRISVGSALARAAWGGFASAAKRIAEGRFDGFDQAMSGAELQNAFRAYRGKGASG